MANIGTYVCSTDTASANMQLIPVTVRNYIDPTSIKCTRLPLISGTIFDYYWNEKLMNSTNRYVTLTDISPDVVSDDNTEIIFNTHRNMTYVCVNVVEVYVFDRSFIMYEATVYNVLFTSTAQQYCHKNTSNVMALYGSPMLCGITLLLNYFIRKILHY